MGEHLVAIRRPGAAFLGVGGVKIAGEKKPGRSTYFKLVQISAGTFFGRYRAVVGGAIPCS